MRNKLEVGSRKSEVNSHAILAVCLLWALLVCLPHVALAQQNNTKQKKEQLQQQMKKLQDEIKTIEAAIKSNSVKKEKSLSEILSLQAKIKSREGLIGNINNQIGDLDETIDKTEEEINTKAGEVEKMKADYASMLRKSYQNLHLQNQVVFLLSANSFYDAIQRYNYLLKIAEYRKGQALAIQKSIGELQVKKEDLQENKHEKETLLEKQNAQKRQLEDEKKQKDAAVAQLQEKEKKLRKTQQEKNKAAAQLNNKIQAIIEEEIRLARKKAEDAAKRSGASNGTTKDVPVKKGSTETIPLTPAEQALSKDFSNNKGKLPWPVVRGHVVGTFGKHEHPALKGVIVENNGVDIKTEAGSDARSLFGGTVVSVFFLPTTQNCVIVKHGEYFTVYSNIENVAVKTGQTLTTKQSLGKLHTDKSEELTKVHLEIWKGKDKMDPSLWLAN
ncbi:MAG TPA: peptidoglycan DD-metalloendopeptidase family protein [Chitinophagales bacterium]|nr:peptidoglycan DD-metalloendopeptidase family protein [Chitinophagales bacterium]